MVNEREKISLGQHLSKPLDPTAGQKPRKNHNKSGADEGENSSRQISMKCLALYGQSCKVGADTCEELFDYSCKRRSSDSEQVKGYRRICGKDKFRKTSNKKDTRYEGSSSIAKKTSISTSTSTFLPDDIIEMCLMRLPLTSLMTARLVCRRWRYLTTTSRFLQMRRDGLYQSPWLFLFGAVKDGYCSGEIRALDVSLDKWHTIDSEILKGRFFFSVASIGDDHVYIVGGCSSLSNFGKLDRTSFKTHKGVFVFSPLTKSWRKVASMKLARSSPVIGVCEVSSEFTIMRNHQNRRFYRSTTGGGSSSDVYEDPHRLSLRRREQGNSSSSSSMEYYYEGKRKASNKKKELGNTRKFVMLVVGGLGSWDEPLDSAEIYDSTSNKWVEIQRLPADFGNVCSGVVCNGMFYVYSESDKLASYDIEEGYWIGIQTSQFPARVDEYHPKLVSSDNRVFVVSVSWCEGDGQIGRRNKAVRKLWELDLTGGLEWNEVCVHPDAPMDWNAAFVGDGNKIFGVEMFKIFGQVLDFLTVCDVGGNNTSNSKKKKWTHISKNHVAHQLDASSCITKTMAVLNF